MLPSWLQHSWAGTVKTGGFGFKYADIESTISGMTVEHLGTQESMQYTVPLRN